MLISCGIKKTYILPEKEAPLDFYKLAITIGTYLSYTSRIKCDFTLTDVLWWTKCIQLAFVDRYSGNFADFSTKIILGKRNAKRLTSIPQDLTTMN